LNISIEGDSTTSLGSLFQYSVTLRGKKFFLMFRRNFLCLSLCPLLPWLSLLKGDRSEFQDGETRAVQAEGYNCPSIIKWSAARRWSRWPLQNPYEFNDALVVSEILPL